ncbi:methylosome subunit pICln isoform X3 [Macrobrachium rosenbergii]|uniref:methylosome subunit pICln isoform X3 n=1 Tax=Macrobrachium rosenbergii TaxID=79674 RepID=UPI0034D65FA8
MLRCIEPRFANSSDNLAKQKTTRARGLEPTSALWLGRTDYQSPSKIGVVYRPSNSPQGIRVTWVKDGDDTGLSLEYPHIAIHAVSRDPASFSFPCLYLMIDVEMEPREEDDEDRESDDEDEAGMTEIRFVPADHMALEPMYKSLSDCQALHPNPEDVQSEEEIGEENDDEGDYIVSDPGQNGFHMPGTYEDNMEGNLENDDGEAMETGQFDDAEDM